MAMKRGAQSQWDFGELFAAGEGRRLLTVSELTGQVKRLLAGQFGSVWVAGEVSNLRLQASGHSYFTLKDAAAQLSCVLFRGQGKAQRDLLQDGRKVNLRGEVTVYEPRGQYQLVVFEIELEGVGALQQAFERLKAQLNAEGLFDPARKRPLPRYPQRIGVVTSPTGAALRDVLTVIRRRQPALELVLAPCRVQGQGAAAEIAEAIRLLNDFNRRQHGPGAARDPAASRPATAPETRGRPLALILVTRGGGSLEDLWAFNEEPVARAIAASELPVVSAVGHEIDFSISDFVADLRAPTPSAAAEILTEGAHACREFLAEARPLLRQLATRRLGLERESLAQVRWRLERRHPQRRVNERWQRLDEWRNALVRTGRVRRQAARAAWNLCATRWHSMRPRPAVERRRDALNRSGQRMIELARHRTRQMAQALAAAAARLDLLSPRNVLARGFSITHDAATGRVVRHAAEVAPGQRLRTQLHSGEVRSIAEP